MVWSKRSGLESGNSFVQVAKSSIYPDFSNGMYTNIVRLSGWDKAGTYRCEVADNYENTRHTQHEVQSNL